MMKKLEVRDENIDKATNKRMLEQMTLHAPQIIKSTSTQDLDPLPLDSNNYPSVLPHDMYALEPGDIPFRILSWKPLGFLSHVKRRSNDDRFPLTLWEVWFCSQIGVPIPELIGTLRQCPCNAFQIDYFGDHLQTCQAKSAATQVHDWVVYRLGGILSSVGHRVKVHNITPETRKERGDVEIRFGNTGLCNIAKTTRLDRLPSSSTCSDSRFYFDAYAFWKITVVFSGTPDAHQEDGWCPRV
jgi:hypothetical protein